MVLGGVRLLLSRIPLSRCHKRCSLDRNRMQMTRFSFYDHDATQSEWAHRLCLSSVHYCEDHFHIHNIHSNTVISNQISTGCGHKIFFDWSITLADPDLDIGGGGRFLSLALPAFFSCCDFFFNPKYRGGGGRGPGPLP